MTYPMPTSAPPSSPLFVLRSSGPTTATSPEQAMVTEPLPRNMPEMGDYFGSFFTLMRRSLVAGGSEFGLGMSLFSLAVSIQAAQIIEIGRFKGFSTLCLAGALRFLDLGWQEPRHNMQRPDVDYAAREQPQVRKLYSIDPFPTPEAACLIKQADLSRYVDFLDCQSNAVMPKPGTFDLAFIDGDHSVDGCRADVMRFVPALRPGGYFVLHDYFGWYDDQRRNNSPIKRVVDEVISTGHFQHLLIDTGYQSFVVFRKNS
jgi:predicted O-methyltransferase YrrM